MLPGALQDLQRRVLVPPQWSIDQLLCVHIHVCEHAHIYVCACARLGLCRGLGRHLVTLANRTKPLAFWRRDKLPS